MDVPTDRLGWLFYFDIFQGTGRKFSGLTGPPTCLPGINVIKTLFSSSLALMQNRLECFSVGIGIKMNGRDYILNEMPFCIPDKFFQACIKCSGMARSITIVGMERCFTRVGFDHRLA